MSAQHSSARPVKRVRKVANGLDNSREKLRELRLVCPGLILLAVLCLFTTANAADTLRADHFDPPRQGVSLLGDDPLSMIELAGDDAQSIQTWQGRVDGLPFERVIRFFTEETLEWGDWQADRVIDPDMGRTIDGSQRFYLRIPFSRSVVAGDLVYVSFYIRASGIFSMQAGHRTARTISEERQNIWMPMTTDGDWKQIRFSFHAKANFDPDQMIFTIRPSNRQQAFELADLHVINLGPAARQRELPPVTSITYQGREPDAPWRQAAQERIERIRMGDLSIRVVDAAGRPVPDARVSVRMQRHAYAFGSAVNVITWAGLNRGAGAPLFPGSHRFDIPLPSELFEAYRRAIPSFNEIVIENSLKGARVIQEVEMERQGVTEHPDGYPWIMDTVRALLDDGIRIRGHYLINGPARHPPGQQLEAEHVDLMIRKLQAMRGRIFEWDAINHPLHGGDYPSEDLLDRYADFLRTARRTAPEVKLFLNEGSILTGGDGEWAEAHGIPMPSFDRRQEYDQLMRDLLERDAPFDGIGMMCHFWWRLTSPERMLEILDRFGRFGKELKMTEFDVNIPDENLQADFTRDFMTVVFSHPATTGIVQWGFWDGSHWLYNTPYHRFDFSLKPAGEVWNDLVFNQWWTDVDGRTNADGRLDARGFHGDYRLEVTHAGQVVETDFTLGSEGYQVTLTID